MKKHDYAVFNGTAEERMGWVKATAAKLQDMMNNNLLVVGRGTSDVDWLDYSDGDRVNTYETLRELNKFLSIISANLVSDFYDHKGYGPDGFID